MGQDTETRTNILPHLQADLIRAAYRGAAGRELETKFLSPESSAALAANAFGLFLGDQAYLLPPCRASTRIGPRPRYGLRHGCRFPGAAGGHPGSTCW